MGVSILEDKNGYKAMYCNTTMWAFGGIFYGDEDVDDFLEWLQDGPRRFNDRDLEIKISEWRTIDKMQ